jgi:hypothetical protein
MLVTHKRITTNTNGAAHQLGTNVFSTKKEKQKSPLIFISGLNMGETI